MIPISLFRSKTEKNLAKVPLVIVGAQTSSLSQVLEVLDAAPFLEVLSAGQIPEILPLISGLYEKYPVCVFVVWLDTVGTFNLLLQWLKADEKRVKSGACKVIALHAPNSLPSIGKLRTLGCSEVLIEPLVPKAWALKLDSVFEAIPEIPRGAMAALLNQKGAQTKVQKRARIVQTVSLKFASDYWLTLGGGAKKISDQWIVRLLGPGPDTGSFNEVDAAELASLGSNEALQKLFAPYQQNGQKLWRWAFHTDKGQRFQKEAGDWYFAGGKIPQFEADLWWFAGSEPALIFVQEGKLLGARFRVDASDTLSVCKDSKQALSQADAIRRTFLGEIPAAAAVQPLAAPAVQAPIQTAPPPPAAVYQEPDPKLDLDLKSHPIALALLASELIRNSDIAVLEKGKQYCNYLSRSLGRIQVELWVFCEAPEPNWKCVGTHNGKEPRLRDAVEKHSLGETLPSPFNEKTSVSEWIKSPTGENLGKLALYADGVKALDADALSEFGVAAVGILKSAQLFFARTTP